ncbi:hypothetical protein BSR29_02365 [Boudabousia liubingyangii]|uniref:Uncharacterized protein n=1 Tax=Boudabousia liubingyangii TaxID=1921764 RepID=A0A1Q5PQR3_9ACTO|nr:hypothetical protein [Boudabousia liubingyangii]OKL46065.1 hypothetical protein BSR28_08340 [Boudabousia liubingyangii]OKL49812.1 hypothetical protein BSR29_02365 [Boudabousia liubingyangii]
MAKAEQILKFLFVLATLMALAWWIKKYSTDSSDSYTPFVLNIWLLLVLLTVFGITHTILYFSIANRTMFTTLKLPSVLLLTATTAAISTGQMYSWKLPESLDSPEVGWMIYYPAIALSTVLLRYFWLRRTSQITAALPKTP